MQWPTAPAGVAQFMAAAAATPCQSSVLGEWEISKWEGGGEGEHRRDGEDGLSKPVWMLRASSATSDR